MSEATELGEIVQNLTKWCNESTKVTSRTKLLTKHFIDRKKILSSIVACTCNLAILQAELRNSVCLKLVGGNSP